MATGDERLAEWAATPDEEGISADMINIMLSTLAEGYQTGSTDMRSLLYCAYRNARKCQKTYETKEQP